MVAGWFLSVMVGWLWLQFVRLCLVVVGWLWFVSCGGLTFLVGCS